MLKRRPFARQQAQPQPLWKTILKRPEAGALGGAILVFIFFSVIAPPFRQVAAFTTVLYQASTIGIPAVAVAMLMIGGEFDLSAGVAVTTSSLAASIFATNVAGNIWVGVVFALVFSLAIGALNGYLLIRTRLHSFLVTLSTFLMLQGLNIAITKLITGNVATGDIGQMPGFDSAWRSSPRTSRSAVCRSRIAIIYWLVFVALATWVLLRTKVGNWIFAVGGQGDSARAVGVPVKRVKIGLFMLVGFGCWFLAMHLLVRLRHGPVRRRHRQRAALHRRFRGRRLPADRRLRLGRRLGARRLHLRHDDGGGHLCGLGSRLVPVLRRRDASDRHRRQHLDPCTRGKRPMR